MNESPHLALSLYNLIFVALRLVVVPTVAFINREPKNQMIIADVAIIIAVTLSILLVFAPKIYMVRRQSKHSAMRAPEQTQQLLTDRVFFPLFAYLRSMLSRKRTTVACPTAWRRTQPKRLLGRHSKVAVEAAVVAQAVLCLGPTCLAQAAVAAAALAVVAVAVVMEEGVASPRMCVVSLPALRRKASPVSPLPCPTPSESATAAWQKGLLDQDQSRDVLVLRPTVALPAANPGRSRGAEPARTRPLQRQIDELMAKAAHLAAAATTKAAHALASSPTPPGTIATAATAATATTTAGAAPSVQLTTFLPRAAMDQASPPQR